MSKFDFSVITDEQLVQIGKDPHATPGFKQAATYELAKRRLLNYQPSFKFQVGDRVKFTKGYAGAGVVKKRELNARGIPIYVVDIDGGPSSVYCSDDSLELEHSYAFNVGDKVQVMQPFPKPDVGIVKGRSYDAATNVTYYMVEFAGLGIKHYEEQDLGRSITVGISTSKPLKFIYQTPPSINGDMLFYDEFDPSKHVLKDSSLTIQCTCDTSLLMRDGCKCGAMAKERKSSASNSKA